MDPRDVNRAYSAIAPHWDADIRGSQSGVTALDRAIRLCKARGEALDAGCGTGGRMIDRLLAAGFAVTGVDVSEGMLEIARRRHRDVAFVQADLIEWQPSGQYDLIVGWDSLFHLPHPAHAPVLAKLCGCLAEGGVLLFTAGGIDGEVEGEMHGERFHYSSLSDAHLVALMADAGCPVLSMERDQFPLHHLVVLAVKTPLRFP